MRVLIVLALVAVVVAVIWMRTRRRPPRD